MVAGEHDIKAAASGATQWKDIKRIFYVRLCMFFFLFFCIICFIFCLFSPYLWCYVSTASLLSVNMLTDTVVMWWWRLKEAHHAQIAQCSAYYGAQLFGSQPIKVNFLPLLCCDYYVSICVQYESQMTLGCCRQAGEQALLQR